MLCVCVCALERAADPLNRTGIDAKPSRDLARCVQLGQEADQVLKAAAEPIDRPCHSNQVPVAVFFVNGAVGEAPHQCRLIARCLPVTIGARPAPLLLPSTP
jgi:hypothetical protein